MAPEPKEQGRPCASAAITKRGNVKRSSRGTSTDRKVTQEGARTACVTYQWLEFVTLGAVRRFEGAVLEARLALPFAPTHTKRVIFECSRRRCTGYSVVGEGAAPATYKRIVPARSSVSRRRRAEMCCDDAFSLLQRGHRGVN